MKIKKIIISLCIFSFMSSPVFANESELTIYKEVLYFNVSRMTVDCHTLIFIQEGKDLTSLRDLPCNMRDTRMTITLTGPPGTSITLFAQHDFGKENGYIVIRKTDEQKVWLRDLLDFPDTKWKTAPAVLSSGGYEAFYKAGPAFDSNVASIKWGQWWGALP